MPPAWTSLLPPRWRGTDATLTLLNGVAGGPAILSRPLLSLDGIVLSEDCKGTERDAWSDERASDDYAVHFMHRGSLACRVGDVDHRLDPTSVMITAPGLTYRYRIPTSTPVLCSHFRATVAALDRYALRPPEADGIRFVRRHAGALQAKYRLLAKSLVEGAALDPLEAETRGVSVLASLFAPEVRDSPSPAPGSARRLARRAQDVLVAHYRERLSLSSLGRAVGASPFHLARTFRRVHGTSIHRYLNRLRLQAAFDRVLDGTEPLTRIALDTGFSSHSHFTYAFRKEFGSTPRRLREAARRN